jgi:hypothetical protein
MFGCPAIHCHATAQARHRPRRPFCLPATENTVPWRAGAPVAMARRAVLPAQQPLDISSFSTQSNKHLVASAASKKSCRHFSGQLN